MRKLNRKNIITAALSVVFMTWGLLVGGQGALAQDAPVKPMRSGSNATTDAPQVFTANTPDQYTVVKGDTLWGIAGRFLQKPWLWPRVWQMNRAQIRNPHWIYPGQIIVFDKINGTMQLGVSGPNGTVILEPSIRIETSTAAISSIPQNVIEPFLREPLVVEEAEMQTAPRIVAAKGDRVVMARGDAAYVSGITDPNVKNYQVFRPGVALKDPDTGKVLGYQANYLGAAQVVRSGDPATILITSFSEEITIGDRLVEAPPARLINYAPHPPEQPVSGKIIDTYNGVGLAGRGMIVSLNRGSGDGMDIGTVLAVKKASRVITDRTNGSATDVTLPEERNGLIFVFRLFDHVSYALVLNAEFGVEPGDAVSPP